MSEKIIHRYELKYTDQNGRTISRSIRGLNLVIEVIEKEKIEIEKFGYKVEFFINDLNENE